MNKKEILLAVGSVFVATLIFVGIQTATKPDFSVGASTSPDISSPYISFGDVRLWASHTGSLNQATTTICALQSPASTSTLVRGTILLTVSSTTASTITLAKATTPYATTTSLGASAITANGQGYAVASTTGSHIFAPNTYFVVGMAGGTGTFSPTGSCNATWQEL